MKALITLILILIIFTFLYSADYLWIFRIATSTVVTDTTFSGSWEYVTIWPDSAACYIQIASDGDTSGIATRDSILLIEGASITIGSQSKLKRLRIWTSSGSGVVYLTGIRRNSH